MPVKFELGEYLTREMIPGYIWDEIDRFIYEKNNNILGADYTFRNIFGLVGLAKANNRIDDKIANELKIRLSEMYS